MRKVFFKSLCISIILFLCMNVNIYAQEGNSLYFVYVDHESTMDINKLCNSIKNQRDDAIEMGTGLIVYLANATEPMVSFTNVTDKEELYSGDERFDNIISALQETNSHEVDPYTDVSQICRIMDYCNLCDANLLSSYKSVTMDFYVGGSFWNLTNNEKILATLYFALEIPEMRKQGLMFNVHLPKGQDIKCESGNAFGAKNIENINTLRLLQY